MKSVYSTEDWAEVLTGENLLLSLLGRVLYTAPHREWLEGLNKGDLFGEPPFGSDQPLMLEGLQMMQAWCQKNQNGLSDQALADLQDDYLRLFIGLDTVLAPVWESVYFNEEHLVFQEQTLAVRQWYARYGAEIERLHKEPDDHIGLEMIFVAYLAQRALSDLEREDKAAFKADLTAQGQFLSEHLLRFAPAWYELVEENASTDFYQALGKLIWGALQAVADLLLIEITSGAAH